MFPSSMSFVFVGATLGALRHKSTRSVSVLSSLRVESLAADHFRSRIAASPRRRWRRTGPENGALSLKNPGEQRRCLGPLSPTEPEDGERR